MTAVTAPAVGHLSGRDRNARRLASRAVARLSCAVIVAVITGVLLMPAASQASRERSCAPIRLDLNYAVKIERGSVRCATARRVLQGFLVSFYAARIQPWACTFVRDGAACFRGGRNRRTARDDITAPTNPKTADDPAAAEVARTAQIAAETIAVDDNGSYLHVSLATIHATEPTIPITARHGQAYLSAAAPTNAGTGYLVIRPGPYRPGG